MLNMTLALYLNFITILLQNIFYILGIIVFVVYLKNQKRK